MGTVILVLQNRSLLLHPRKFLRASYSTLCISRLLCFFMMSVSVRPILKHRTSSDDSSNFAAEQRHLSEDSGERRRERFRRPRTASGGVSDAKRQPKATGFQPPYLRPRVKHPATVTDRRRGPEPGDPRT